MCLEGFLYGNLSVLLLVTTEQVQLFPVSRSLFRDIRYIFALAIPIEGFGVQDSGTKRCFLHSLYSLLSLCCYLCLWFGPNRTWSKWLIILSLIISFLSSVLQSIASISRLSPQLQIESQRVLNRISIAQLAVNACCDFTSQCIIVRIVHFRFVSIIHFIHLNLHKDLSVLDRVG